jgi:CubicO group peptidase (beta-lactamase class C family)
MTSYILRNGSAESAGMDAARVARISSLVAGWVKEGETPSAVVLVARRGVIVLHEAFGVRRHDDTTPTLKLDSIFPVASVAKPMTASAVMCLVEDGLIGLNRPFVDYIPELDVPDVEGLADAKVADLLCHTAGYDDLDVNAYIAAAAKRSPNLPPSAPEQHPKINERTRLAAGAPLTYRPGSTAAYSAFGYMLLGDIVRRVSGQPFWKFVQSRLFEPLGMRDSHFVLPPEMRERRVYRAPGMPGTLPGPLHGGLDSPGNDEIDSGAGGLATTASDLAQFMQMMLNRGSYGGRRVLHSQSVAAMTRDQLGKTTPVVFPRINPTTGERVDFQIRIGGYGFGMAVFGEGDRFRSNGSLGSLSSFGHVGWGGACVWADPERDLLGVYLSVSPRMVRDVYVTNVDLLQNAVQSAVVE